jgi:hypothetical protein
VYAYCCLAAPFSTIEKNELLVGRIHILLLGWTFAHSIHLFCRHSPEGDQHQPLCSPTAAGDKQMPKDLAELPADLA